VLGIGARVVNRPQVIPALMELQPSRGVVWPTRPGLPRTVPDWTLKGWHPQAPQPPRVNRVNSTGKPDAEAILQPCWVTGSWGSWLSSHLEVDGSGSHVDMVWLQSGVHWGKRSSYCVSQVRGWQFGLGCGSRERLNLQLRGLMR